MAWSLRRRIGFGALAFAGAAAASTPGCTTNRSAIVLAISTDMKAPKDVNAVGVTVFTNNVIRFNVLGRVTPEGDVLLPATLAVVEPDDPNATIRIRVVAFQEQKARVMREVLTSITPGGRIAMLRIPLNFADDGSVSAELPDGVLPVSATAPTADGGTASTASYDPTLFVPNCDDPNETWVAGGCTDAHLDWDALPDYAPAAIGRADDPATCFDVTSCFRGAPQVPETGDTGVTLDRASCSLLLHGADPTQLNVALVTPDTGWCITPGNCYVAIDHAAAGWTETADRVTLPAYVCRLLTEKNLRLAQAPTACGAKTEARASCQDNDEGDAGVQSNRLIVAEDFASSVATANRAFYFAGATRIGRLDVATGAVTTFGVPASHSPWKLGFSNLGALLTNAASTTAYTLDLASNVQIAPVSFSGQVLDAVATDASTFWVVRGPGIAHTTSFADTTPMSSADATLAGTTAITSLVGLDATGKSIGGSEVLLGSDTGSVRACTVLNGNDLQCSGIVTLGSSAGRVEALAPDPTTAEPSKGAWALADKGLYYLTTTGTGSTVAVAAPSAASDASDLTGITEGTSYYPRNVAATASCAVYSGPGGLKWFSRSTTASGTLVPASGRQIVGVAIGPVDASTGNPTALYTVYAAASDGGGVYRATLPADCKGTP